MARQASNALDLNHSFRRNFFSEPLVNGLRTHAAFVSKFPRAELLNLLFQLCHARY